MTSAVFTIVAKNYLSHARALMRTVERTSPDVLRFVILVDEPEGCFDPRAEGFTVIPSKLLPIPSSEWFRFKYTVLELSTAVKPYAAEFLMEERGVDRLIYLDPDILAFSSLDEHIFPRLSDADILLTPHLTRELNDGRHPDELTILRAGTYNLGFVALRKSPAVSELLTWWQERLYDQCVVSPHDGIFVDQKWMDLAPGLFPGVEIVRDPGWNVAYWNIHSRDLRQEGDEWRVNGRPLVFFHYSGFDPRQPNEFSRHQDRFTAKSLGDASRLLEVYREELFENGFEEVSHWPYTWARFHDGTDIPDIARPVHHEDPSILERVEDPFSEEGKKAFFDVWSGPSLHANGRRRLSRLAALIYNSRPDVRSAMPDVLGADRNRFRDWIRTSGAREHGLPESLLDAIADRRSSGGTDGGEEEHGPRVLDDEWLMRAASRFQGIRDELLEPLNRDGEGGKEAYQEVLAFLNEQPETDPGRPRMTRLARHILRTRPDVERRFQRNGQPDYLRVFPWLLTYARKEFDLPDACADEIRRDWKRYLGGVSLYSRLASYGWLVGLSAAAFRGRGRASFDNASALARSRRVIPASEPASVAHGDHGRPKGVNLVGYARSEMGVGESVRRAHAALEAVGVPVSVTALSTNGAYPDSDDRVEAQNSLRYSHHLLHVNADELPRVARDLLGEGHDPAHNIGYWAWELESFPERFDHAFQLCREVWTPSEFCRVAIAERSPVPVVRIPHPVVVSEPKRGRAEFGIAPGSFTFLTMFDMLSVYERKNPRAVVAAFRRLHERSPGAELVVKANSVHHNREAMEELRRSAEGLPVQFLEETLSRSEVDSLINACDCFVSLHRSEGFGLVMAEAMYLGKPVIATGYSGNLDFMNNENSLLVDYEMGETTERCAPYAPNQRWAEPSVEHAAELMGRVFEHQELGRSLGEMAAQDVQQTLSPYAVGKTIKKRLDVIFR